jgi:hypothetical protein
MQARGIGVRATERMASMGDVIWVLVVIAFWMGVGLLVVSLIRVFASSHDNEETMCELPEPMPTPTEDKLATT